LLIDLLPPHRLLCYIASFALNVCWHLVPDQGE
jgi:hypothetical protein